jgi:phosphoenolpyruvate phosphomutase
LSGKLGQSAGFDLIWGSGFEISASYGVPDANVLTMTEQLRQCAIINEAVDIPVIADCDNGFGNAINAAVATRRFEAAGIAGLCIEDNLFPKRCSFYKGVNRELASIAEHVGKVKACKDTQATEKFFVIARTEALIAGATVAEALDRASAYAEAGADAILVHSKLATPDQLISFSERWDLDCPLVSVPTTYDNISAENLHKLGYSIVIFANQGIRSAILAMERNLSLLRSSGRAADLREAMVPLSRVFELVDVDGLRKDEAKYLPTPPAGVT